MEAKAFSSTYRTKVSTGGGTSRDDQCVTLGDLGGSAGGAAATDPISESEMGREARRGVGAAE